MFLTQINGIKRSKSTYLQGYQHLKQNCFLRKKISVSAVTTPKLSHSKSVLRGTQTIVQKVAQRLEVQYGRLTAQQKWSRIVQLFQMPSPNQQQIEDKYPDLYACLLKVDLIKNVFKFNLPQTILVDQDSSLQLFHTPSQYICKKTITKPEVNGILEKGHQIMVDELRKSNKYKYYGDKVNIKVNNNALFVILKQLGSTDNTLQVQTQRNFGQNRWRATNQNLVQRYVYSRNLKAIILRVSFHKAQRGHQHHQYSIHRFQNIAFIFRNNTNDSHNLRSKLSPSLLRPNTLEYSKLTGPGVLEKMVQPASQVRRLLQIVTGKRILKLSVDMIEDLTGKLWIIGIKGAKFEQRSAIIKKQQWLMATEVGFCKLCNGLFEKSQLKNNVSVRMLLQFLHHLKKRTKIQNLSNVQYFSTSSLNRKENAMSAVCQCCYAIIINELQLQKYERILGNLCHIHVDDDGMNLNIEYRELRQWRLMVYLEQIKQVSNGIGRVPNLAVRYTLGRGIQQKWKCSYDHGTISVKKVKIHYFYSQTTDILDFLINSQIVVSVIPFDGDNVLAQGSTSILANFKNKFLEESGQRQTTTVLLFFQSGKYCELTLKVGIVYDGIYRSPHMPMKNFHSVLFPTKDCLNSNPLPKQWMEIFGFDQEILLKQVKYQQILPNKKKIGVKESKLKKKGIRYS